MVGGVSNFAEKGIVSILSEESKCRLVVTVKPRRRKDSRRCLDAAVVKPHHAQEAYRSLAMMTALYTVCWSSQFIP